MERNPLCFVIGFPFSSYIEDLLETPWASMHRKDSHWFLPTESPANTTLPFLPLFRISLALNLSRNRRSELRKISIYRRYKLPACTSLLNQIAGECRHASSGKMMANIHHIPCVMPTLALNNTYVACNRWGWNMWKMILIDSFRTTVVVVREFIDLMPFTCNEKAIKLFP